MAPVSHMDPVLYQVEQDILSRVEKDIPLPSRRMLILCEGETEVAYFEGIKTNPFAGNAIFLAPGEEGTGSITFSELQPAEAWVIEVQLPGDFSARLLIPLSLG